MSEPGLGLTTPERVTLELPIAGIGTRALAWLVDAGLLFAAALVLYFAYTLVGRSVVDVYLDLGGAARIGALVAGFAVIWLYWTVMEVLWHGQTVGKRLLRIRVVRRDGSPVGPFESAVRNLVRAVDFLPACYPVGIICMLVDPQHRRVGDLLAGTVLIREAAIDLSRYQAAQPAEAGGRLSARDVEVVTGYLARFEQLDAAAQVTLGRQLASHLGVPAAQLDGLDAKGLRTLLAAKVGAA